MIKFWLTLLLLFILRLGFSQTNEILSEDFEGSEFPPNEWITIDHDGDGQGWYQESRQGNMMAASDSWNSGALTPYNYLVTSEIDLSDYSTDDNLGVFYRIGASGSSYFLEHYKLVVSTTGQTHGDLETGEALFEETLTALESGWNLSDRLVNISAYAGEKIHLAWVHYDCTDQDRLLLDDILVYEGDDPDVDEPTPYTSWLVGNQEDIDTENHLSGVVLAGGGGDNNDAMKWFLNRADGGDVVVIRASGEDGYNNYLYSGLGVAVNSVETILINSIEAAEHPYVEQQIRNAEALFIAGGDQYNYYQYWKDTPVMDAINYLINEKGVVVGGSSAGMAILGKVYYTPSGSGAQSGTVLNDPYHNSMNIIGRDDFIDIPILENTITDTHFDDRDRSGRLFTFMARMVADWNIEAKGIAANEYTAVCFDTDGKAYVYGDPSYNDYAYFLKSQDCAPETCTSGQPLTWYCNQKAVKVYKVKGKNINPNYFDLSTWSSGKGGEWEYWYAKEGTLNKTDVTSSQININQNLSVFPNPASEHIWLNAKDMQIQRVEIISTLGVIIKSIEFNNSESSSILFNLKGIPSGMVMLRVETSEGFLTQRLIISK